jgi:predicted esterase
VDQEFRATAGQEASATVSCAAGWQHRWELKGLKMVKHAGWIFLLLAMAAPGWAKTKITNQSFQFEGRLRSYSLYVPDFAGPMPVVLILHGYTQVDRNGFPQFEAISCHSMVDSWKDLASSEHFIVAAPKDEESIPGEIWNGDLNAPAFFRAVLEQVDAQHPIDGTRIYLFGDTEGGQYALSLAIIDAFSYAAVAVHAGVLDPGYPAMIARATRRMPIALWAGNLDLTCLLYNVKQSKAILEANGFPVELNVLPNHGHNYFTLDGMINEKVWKFLKKSQFKPPQIETENP